MAGVDRDIQHAIINITRNGDDLFKIDVFDPWNLRDLGPPLASEQHRVTQNQPTVFALGGVLPQSLWLERINNGGFGSPFRITYSNNFDAARDLGQDQSLQRFSFETRSRGISRHPNRRGDRTNEDRYCQEYPLVYRQQTFECVFPILARAGRIGDDMR